MSERLPWAAPWRDAVTPFALCLACILAIHFGTGAAMVGIWARSNTFAHAFMVPPIVLWLIWRRRHVLAMQIPAPSFWVLSALGAISLMWLLGQLVAVNAMTQAALVAMLVLSVPAVLGWRVAATLLFPLTFLFFAVPIGDFMLPYMIDRTADFTTLAVRLSGVPVYREGNQLIIPTGTWSVVEACSGVRYFIASFMIGSLFAYLNYRSTKRRVLFMVVALTVPIIANWLRAYMIVMLGHLSNNTIAVGVDHLIYGWVFFGIVITIVFFIGARWAEAPLDRPPTESLEPRHAANPASAASFWGAAVLTVVIVALPHGVLWAVERGESAQSPRLDLSALPVAPWQPARDRAADWQPVFENPSAKARVVFEKEAQSVGLLVAYYRDQGENRKLVSSQNVLVSYDDNVWKQVGSGVATVAADAGRSLEVRTTRLLRVRGTGETQGQRLLVWKVYWVNGTWTSSDYAAKLAGAWHRLRGRGDESAAIVLFAEDAEPGQAEQALSAFVKANFGALESALNATRGGSVAQ